MGARELRSQVHCEIKTVLFSSSFHRNRLNIVRTPFVSHDMGDNLKKIRRVELSISRDIAINITRKYKVWYFTSVFVYIRIWTMGILEAGPKYPGQKHFYENSVYLMQNFLWKNILNIINDEFFFFRSLVLVSVQISMALHFFIDCENIGNSLALKISPQLITS